MPRRQETQQQPRTGSPDPANGASLRALIAIAFVGLLVFEFAALLGVAQVLSLDYFDSFQYLKNARVLAESGSFPIEIDYTWRRPPLVPLVQAMLYPAGEGLSGAVRAFHASHLLAWSFSVVALAAVYLHLRRSVEAMWALLGVVLIALNPIFLHLVPFALVDVPAMLFTILALDGFLRFREARSMQSALLSGLLLAAAMSTKYNLLLLLPCIVGLELVAALFERRSPVRALLDRPFLVTLVSAVAGWLLLHLAVLMHLEGFSVGAVIEIFRTTVGEFAVVSAAVWDDPPTEYLQELFQVTPLLLILVAFVGLGLAFRERRSDDLLHAIWLVAFLSVMSLGIGSKSSRYLLPMLPSLVHLQLRGLGWLHSWLVHRVESRGGLASLRWVAPAASAGGLALVLWLPLVQAFQQVRHFDDPVYRTPIVERLVRTIEEGAPAAAPILWRGALHSMYPEDPVFFPHDETFMFYHFGARALEYFLAREVGKWDDARDLDEEALVEVFDAAGVVVTSVGALHMTHLADELPGRRDPLFVDIVERRSFDRASDRPLALVERRQRKPRVELVPDSHGYAFREDPRDDGWQAFVRAAAGAPLAAMAAPPFPPPASLELVRRTRTTFRYGD
jgi:4-amino-4-deoxy-L-arabinose transferase-like glycosyltransferase